ncbi:MAG: hypothetical protein U9R19_17485, partial [Bacteroidota bacterium]|nr:hypothetical protein [Bacteroidota bacterium]
MKYILSLVLLISIIHNNVIAQNNYNNDNSPPFCENIYSVYQPLGDYPIAYDICSDIDGNMYICGVAGYEPLFEGSTIYTNKCFWAKFNTNGELLMNIDIMGNFGFDASFTDICVDEDKNIYGIFEAALGLIFNNDTFFTSNGEGYKFIAKWDSLGNEIWIKQIDTYRINDIKVNDNGTVVCAGYFTVSMQIDSIQYFYCGNNTLAEDVFIASFNANNGNTQWVNILGNEDEEHIFSIEIDSEGNVYAPIQFDGDSTQIGNSTVTRTNTQDELATVICKINNTGTIEWNFLLDGYLNIRNISFVNNNFYFSFYLVSDTLKYDSITYVNPTSRAGFFGKINTLGYLQWLTTINTDIGNVVDLGLSTNSNGETVIYGRKSGSAIFTYNSQVLDSTNNNIFYLKLDDNGNLQWYKSYMSTASPGVLSGITWGKKKDFYSVFSGIHQNAVITLGSYTLTDTLGQYAFIPKMRDFSNQKVPLPIGWGMVSGFIEPHNDTLVSVLDSVANNLIIVKNNAGNIYWPQYGVN